MKRLFELGKSIFKSNRIFSMALILIYTLTMSLLVMLCFFTASVDKTFNTFLDEYGLPDAYITTNSTIVSYDSKLSEIDGIKKVDTRFVIEAQTELPSEVIYQLRYFSINEDANMVLYNVDKKENVEINDDTVAISSVFAKSNDLKVGDSLLVYDQQLIITDIISTPETIAVSKDGSSWYDTTTFGYVYISEKQIENIIGFNIINQYEIYCDDGNNAKEILEQCCEILGDKVISSELVTGGSIDKQIAASIDGTKAVVSYLPSFIVIIGILFALLFTNQIILNSRKKIAILETFGYTYIQLILLFISYSLALTLISSALGILVGRWLLKIMLEIYQNVYYLPQIIISGNTILLILLLIIIQLMGVFVSIICCLKINKIDPTKVLNGTEIVPNKMPNFINKIHLNSFDKITISQMLRNYKRIIISILCSLACLCLNHAAISILVSKSVGLNTLFEQRLTYDVVAYCDDEGAIQQIKELDGVLETNEKITFYIEYEDETMNFESLVISDKTKVIDINYQTITLGVNEVALEEGFARRHNLKIGDEIKINDINLKVVVLLREYFNPTMYLTYETALNLGYEQYNAVNVYFEEGYKTLDFSKAVNDIEGFDYFVDINRREVIVRETLSQLDMPCVLFVMVALIVGLVIVINMNLITLKQKQRQYATLKILGTERFRFTKMSVQEIFVHFSITLSVGLPLAYKLTNFIMINMSSVSQEYVLGKNWLVSIIASALVLVYLVIGALVTNIYIDKMNIVKALNEKQ